MSGGISAGTWATIAATAVSAVSTGYQMSQKPPKLDAPQVKAPEPLKQESQAPDAGTIKKNNAAIFAGAGQQSTMLTGLDGIAPGGLNLGKNTLLGA